MNFGKMNRCMDSPFCRTTHRSVWLPERRCRAASQPFRRKERRRAEQGGFSIGHQAPYQLACARQVVHQPDRLAGVDEGLVVVAAGSGGFECRLHLTKPIAQLLLAAVPAVGERVAQRTTGKRFGPR